MAKGGPVISAGPAIASPRGGAPFGVRVGGVEGGRSIRLSPADLKINNIFGPAITSPSQIGFKPGNKPGFESVRSLVPLNIPIRGENQARSQVPPGVESKPVNVEPAKAGPEARPGTVIIKTSERPSNQGFVEQVFARRLRTNLVRLTVPGVGTRTLTGIETSAAVKTQVQLQVGSVPETARRTTVGTAPKPEVKTGRPIKNIVTNKTGNPDSHNISQREEDRRKRYIGQDLKTNNSRLEALTSKFEQLNASSFQGVVDGAVLARESKIGTARRFRSRLLDQKGYDRKDGSQWRIELELTAKANVGRGQLEELIEANSAVEVTDKPPLKLATPGEVIKVLTPPNSLVTHIEPVIVEEVTEKLVVTREVGSSVLAAQPIQVFGEPKIRDAEKSEPVADNVIISPSRLLDMEEYINSNEVFKRRQLILAA